MGKATRWLRSLFRWKKLPTRSIGWGSGSHQESNGSGGPSYPELADADKHAIAVAAATTAVAEAAFAAAHAAAEVLRLTNESFGDGGSRGWYGGERRMEVAAVIIQSAFRAYLARTALRALKALVKLQALVRGHIVRKQSAYMFHRMQAMLRAQARATAARTILSGSPHSSTRSFHFHQNLISSPTPKHRGLFSFVDESNDKILEVDTWKPRPNPTVSNKSTHHSYLTPTKPTGLFEVESTAENTPHAYSDGNIRGRSNSARASRGEYPQSLFGDHARHPNYMSNTASWRAKLRSNSVPRRRILFESSSTSTRQHWDCSDTNSERYF